MKEKLVKHKKLLIVCGIIVVLLLAAVIVLSVLLTKKKDEQSAETFSRQRRTATVSDTIELEGTVSVGTKSQTFTLDIDAFSGQSFTWSMGGGMGAAMGGGMGGSMPGGETFTTGGTSSSSETRQLTVEEVYVQVGQQITAGEPILKISQSSLEQLRQDFEADADEAKNVYDQALTSQQQTENEAALTKAENELYGSYAELEYELSLSELTASVETIQESIDSVNEEILELQEEIAETQAAITTHQVALNNAERAGGL